MTGGGNVVTCDFCKQGRVTMRMEEIEFRQWSDKGNVHCRVRISVGVCNHCQSKSLDPESDRIFDAAFRLEYDKLP